MKREILFRAQKLDTKEWVEGCLVEDNGHCVIIQKTKTNWIDVLYGCSCYINTRAYKVIPETVGQFTGLTDKNGTKIFEGDILRVPPKDEYGKITYNSYEVFWHDNDSADNHTGWQCNRLHCYGASAGGSCIYSMLPKHTKELIVIGNIFDNPELL